MSESQTLSLNKINAEYIRTEEGTVNASDVEISPLETCLSCVGGFLLGICVIALCLGIIGGFVALITFDIMALAEYSNRDITNKCSDSSMWIYLLVSLILMFVQSGNSKDTNENNYGNHLIVFLPMTIWGCIEFWDVKCVNEIENTAIYYMANIHFILYIISSSIFALIILLSMCGILTSITDAVMTTYKESRR